MYLHLVCYHNTSTDGKLSCHCESAISLINLSVLTEQERSSTTLPTMPTCVPENNYYLFFIHGTVRFMYLNDKPKPYMLHSKHE